MRIPGEIMMPMGYDDPGMNVQHDSQVRKPEQALDNSPWEVTPLDVQALLEQGQAFLLLDCRTAEEWESGAIERSMNLPLQQVSTRSVELNPHRNQPIITYCRTGRRSIVVAKYLRLSGFLHVRSMAGGYQAWVEMTNESRDES